MGIKKDKLELDFKEARQGGKILEVEHISKKFDDLVIVDNFSYVFKKNDRIGVVGKNGIGKSTFFGYAHGQDKSGQRFYHARIDNKIWVL